MGLCIFVNVTVTQFCIHLMVRNKGGLQPDRACCRKGRRGEATQVVWPEGCGPSEPPTSVSLWGRRAQCPWKPVKTTTAEGKMGTPACNSGSTLVNSASCAGRRDNSPRALN